MALVSNCQLDGNFGFLQQTRLAGNHLAARQKSWQIDDRSLGRLMTYCALYRTSCGRPQLADNHIISATHMQIYAQCKWNMQDICNAYVSHMQIYIGNMQKIPEYANKTCLAGTFLICCYKARCQSLDGLVFDSQQHL